MGYPPRTSEEEVLNGFFCLSAGTLEGRKEDGVARYKKDDLCQGRTAKT
jgi:hypothetical protein